MFLRNVSTSSSFISLSSFTGTPMAIPEMGKHRGSLFIYPDGHSWHGKTQGVIVYIPLWPPFLTGENTGGHCLYTLMAILDTRKHGRSLFIFPDGHSWHGKTQGVIVYIPDGHSWHGKTLGVIVYIPWWPFLKRENTGGHCLYTLMAIPDTGKHWGSLFINPDSHPWHEKTQAVIVYKPWWPFLTRENTGGHCLYTAMATIPDTRKRWGSLFIYRNGHHSWHEKTQGVIVYIPQWPPFLTRENTGGYCLYTTMAIPDNVHNDVLR